MSNNHKEIFQKLLHDKEQELEVVEEEYKNAKAKHDRLMASVEGIRKLIRLELGETTTNIGNSKPDFKATSKGRPISVLTQNLVEILDNARHPLSTREIFHEMKKRNVLCKVANLRSTLASRLSQYVHAGRYFYQNDDRKWGLLIWKNEGSSVASEEPSSKKTPVTPHKVTFS